MIHPKITIPQSRHLYCPPVWLFGLLLCLPLPVAGQSLRTVFQQVNPSVVVVHTEKESTTPDVLGLFPTRPMEPQGMGSGVLISADGKVLTAAHVVQTAEQIKVEFLNGQLIPARVLAAAPFADLALLQLASLPNDTPVARLGNSDQATAGDQIFVVGAPHGIGHSLAVGYLSARRTTEQVYENLTALETFQIDLAIYQGNSGGPVFNLNGEVIGIVTHVLAQAGTTTGPGFAVTSNVARRLILEEQPLWLGVEALLLDGPLAESLNLPQFAGLLVQSVAGNSLGKELGLRGGKLRVTLGEQPQLQTLLLGGDIILEMQGQPVRPSAAAFQEMQRTLNRLRPPEILKVKVLRSGQVVELQTRISER